MVFPAFVTFFKSNLACSSNFGVFNVPCRKNTKIKIPIYTGLLMLKSNGIETKANKSRGLDHGALIPLMLLFPNDKIPTLQMNLGAN